MGENALYIAAENKLHAILDTIEDIKNGELPGYACNRHNIDYLFFRRFLFVSCPGYSKERTKSAADYDWREHFLRKMYSQSNISAAEFEQVYSRVMESLPEREKEIVTDYFKNGMTFEQIGVKYGITKQRVHKIYHKACERLRHPKRASAFYYGSQYIHLLGDAKDNLSNLTYSAFIDVRMKLKGTENYKEQIEELKESPIEVLELDCRVRNTLKRAGIHKVKNILCLSEKELKNIRGMGNVGYRSIKEKMLDLGLCPQDDKVRKIE